MNNFLNQLNLTPQERRIVVIIFLVVIVVLNLLFVWPHFGEWASINKQLEDMRRSIAQYNHLIDQDLNATNGFKVMVNKLSRLEGGSVMEHPMDPKIQLGNTIRSQERKTGVSIYNFGTDSVKTNEFFEEISTPIDVESQEPQLVSFLYNMGMDPAMIRVAKLDLKPADNNRYKLKGSITLTANYTKKPPAAVNTNTAPKVVVTSKAAPAPINKPAAAAVPAPNTKRPPPGVPAFIRQPQGGKPNLPDRPMPTRRHAGQQNQPVQPGQPPP